MATYVCPQCGPAPEGPNAHAEVAHVWPAFNEQIPMSVRMYLRDLAADLEDLLGEFELPGWVLEDVARLRELAGLGK